MKLTRDARVLRWGTLLVWLISLSGMYAFSLHIREEGWLLVSRGLRVVHVLGWAGTAGLAVLLVISWLGQSERVLGWLRKIDQLAGRLGWVLLPLLVGLGAAFPILMMGRFQVYLAQDWTRQAVFVWLALLGALCISAYWQKDWLESVLFSALGMAVVYHLTTYIPHVTDYPFSLWWSETTRFYLASTFFDQRIYGQDLPWVFRDLTRYLIQAVPYLIPDSPLWLHRLWQASLRFSTPYITGLIIARRMNLSPRKLFWGFTLWAGLYFFQGPVFYNLIVIVMLVFWLVDARRFWKTLVVVAGVSIYAGFSRINWVPMPGLLAAAFYILETPLQGKYLKSIARYLALPAVWVAVGAAAGLGAQQFWAASSGNPQEIYYASFTSYLIKARLLPNPSYPLGILPHVLIVTAPLLIFLGLGLRGWRKKWHPLRLLGIGAIIAVLFGGGTLVSLKIGGGTNLHNMDVYLVILLAVAVEYYFGRVVDEQGQPVKASMPLWLKTLVVAMPVIFVITFVGRSITTLDKQAARQNLAQLQKYVDQATVDGGEVLFISQRHLLTFDLIQGVELVHPHEKLLLQEMVMSRNESYLANFSAEMTAQKYDLIVTDHLPSVWKNPDKTALADENNVVLDELVPLITCAYEETDRLLDGSLDILTPRQDVTCAQPEE